MLSQVWKEISMDFVTGLLESQGSTHLLVMMDRLSKGVILEPCDKMDAHSLATTSVRCFTSQHGFPRAITSDRGTQFVSQSWACLCALLKIQQLLSTSHHPQTDGSTERMNRTVAGYPYRFCNHQQSDWADQLPMCELSINNRASSTTGVSPFFLTDGFHVDLIELPVIMRSEDSTLSPAQRAEQIVAKLAEVREHAESSMAYSQQRMQDNANKTQPTASAYKSGDLVWLDLKHILADRPSKKLDVRYARYRVVKPIGGDAYQLDTPPSAHNVFHVDRLYPASADPLPSQKQVEHFPPPVFNGQYNATRLITQILRERKRGKGRQILIQWAD